MSKYWVWFGIFFCAAIYGNDPLYFCTVSDEKHYPLVVNLIASIHRVHFDELGSIAVFNIGMKPQQIRTLKRMHKVQVHDIRMVHPDLLQYVYIGRPLGDRGPERWVRGWYAWKPVALKQASELFPYFLYLDAGAVVMQPIGNLFTYIQKHGFFSISCGHSISWMTTAPVIALFGLSKPERLWILDKTTQGLSAGLVGIDQREYARFIDPLYKLAHDITHFVDDGTTPQGFGTGRHDQPLLSILARILGYHIFDNDHEQKMPLLLDLGDHTAPLYITELPECVSYKTQIYQCRREFAPNYTAYLRIKGVF